MNQIKTWLEEHKISSHSIAAALVVAATAYTTNIQIQGFVNSMIGAHPTWIVNLTALSGIILNYMGSHNTQGQVAQIANTPAQKVADAVTAVKASEAPPAPPAAPDLQNVVAAAAAKETPKP